VGRDRQNHRDGVCDLPETSAPTGKITRFQMLEDSFAVSRAAR